MNFSQRIRFVTSALLGKAITQGAIGGEKILDALTATAERRRKIFREQTCVPDRYKVFLSPQDLAELKPFLKALHSELAGELIRRLKQKGFSLNSGGVSIEIRPHPDVAVGNMRVAGRFEVPRTGGTACTHRGIRLLIAPRTPQERKVELVEGIHTVGRGDGVDVALPPEDRLASKLHCRIDVLANGAVLQDLGSTNGTCLNDRPVAEPCALSPGDRIVLGGTLIEVAA
jgi:hypothetical protein